MIKLDKVIEDKELGRLIVRINSRAKRLIFRTKNNEITVTVPPQTSEKEVEAAVEQLRAKLLASKDKLSNSLINLDYKINTEYFRLSLIKDNRDQFLAHSELGEMQIICPPSADFADEKLQTWLRKVIEEALRRNAKIILPPRLYTLAEQNKLRYKSVKINSSRGRWGSCSAQKGINLSYFLVLLPQHLIDYVLLHELCHTREMNHGERFWDLLNSYTDGKALILREELKKYKTDI
ncbi:MAG: zinc protease [Bacteroidetes bacterium]|nr:zinc protease [Bacteroidota bacterium]